MTKRLNTLLVAVALLVPAGAGADLPAPKVDPLRDYRTEVIRSPDLRGDPIDAWETALATALAGQSPDQAADALAPRFALPRAQMRELVHLWLFANVDKYGLDRNKAQRQELRARLLALLAASGRAPLVLEAAASILSGDIDCDVDAFDPLMTASVDKAGDAWRIAHAARNCAALVARFTAIAPDRALPALIAVATNDDWLTPDVRIALLGWLSGPGLVRIDAAHRDAVRLYFTHAYIVALLKAGLSDRAIAAFEAVPAAERPALIARSTVMVRIEADGLPTVLDDYTVHAAQDAATLRTGLAAAYALAGRTAEAEAMFAAQRTARPGSDCSTSDGSPCPPPKPGDEEGAADTALLDHFLHHAGDDPYPIAETYYASDHGSVGDGVMAELACRVFDEPGYRALCARGRDITRRMLEPDDRGGDEQRDARAILAAAQVPGQAEARRDIATALAPVIARGAPDRRGNAWRDRPAIDPAPSPFAEHPIPAAERGTAPAMKWSKAFAPLPEGYQPVRIARDGQRLAVISLSQNYDPTGEISQGGYWVHLSDDGGRSWRRPLYTGLAQHFPYDVVPDAKLPLFDGDTLNIAVSVRLLDTSSISYPPVALRLKRRADDLYLAVPIAELTRDSDHDGLTDLAARHLLLAPDPAGTAFVVGHDDTGCSAADAETREARTKVLEQIFGRHTGALIEPAERKGNDPFAGVLSGLRDPTSADRPILVAGVPADFACLHPDRLMIVYNEAQIARLRRMTPDFHAVDLPPVVFNRARTRGYFIWSSGWTGGTIRLTRDATGRWKLETISSWIT